MSSSISTNRTFIRQKESTDATLRSILNDTDEYVKWTKNDFRYSKYDEDDNNCIAECYFWKDRVEV